MAIFNLFSGKQLSDEEILQRYKSSEDKKWLGIIYERYTHLAFAVCMKYLKNEASAEDAVMDVFEKLMSDLLKHEISNFQSWLHTYLRNHCLMQLRKGKSARIISIDEKNEDRIVESNDGLHPTDKDLLEYDLQNLEIAISELKEEQRQCVELFYLKKLSYEDVSRETGYAFKEVKSHIQNGKRNLKLKLNKKA